MSVRRGKKKRLATAAAAGTLILMLPLITESVAAAMPSAAAAIFSAAKASALLSAGELFTPRAEQNSADKPLSDTTEDTPVLAVFAVDDSLMLSRGDLLMPNSTDEERAVPETPADAGPRPYPETLENRDGVITAMTYGHMNGDSFIDLDIAGQVRNVTSLPNEKIISESRLLPEFKIEKGAEPQVLIMHTHATESYEPYERDFYDKSFNSRTTDKSMNMTAVGNKIAEQLESAGISVIHDTTLHDYPSYNGSYDLSRETVKKYLAEYPSIKVVLDVHRDAIERADGERIAPVAEINGKNAAQVMIISGCDDGTMGMPDCMKNLRFACMLQKQMESDWAGLTRPVLFDYRKYNQDLTAGSLLIEVGGHANSMEQALYSGELIGRSLAECLSELT